jgi:hypothetical protein
MASFHQTAQPILDVFDEGILLYRRGFVVFVLLTAMWIVPLAVGVGLLIVFEQEFVFVVLMLLSLPLAVYLVGGLSRATTAVQQERVPGIGEALRIGPLRLLGMGLYSLVFMIVVNILTSVVMTVFFCSGMFALVAVFGASTAAINSELGQAVSVIMGVLFLLLILLFYAISLLISGAVYCSLIYGLQPFIQHPINFGQAVQHSINLITYRFGFNLLAFFLTSMLFSATALVITIAIGSLLPLPLLLALGQHSPVAQGVSIFAWIVGLIVVLPPLPIWMTLLYQRNHAAREGSDLVARIAATTQEGAL